MVYYSYATEDGRSFAMEHGFDTAFYRAVLDRIQSNIYITDPETDLNIRLENLHMS